MIAPLQVWQAWPDHDLFGFAPPEQEETYRQYRDRIGDQLSEDRLFHFVLAELCNEDLSLDEANHRLQRAVKDLRKVKAVLDDRKPVRKVTMEVFCYADEAEAVRDSLADWFPKCESQIWGAPPTVTEPTAEEEAEARPELEEDDLGL